ncbi:DUF4382 domain-containing protein [Haloarchaeobius salinus]|uniref:DUF4382 domain-containing protein n=1 Tax=Haloarchaeobius salinus TaxID=1198298 RepID=UPI00210D991B|nr:DUF4382 domain-containing protein [Haloarchaeobius salinus]
MSRPTALLAIALAALLVTAGCLGGVTGNGDDANTDGDDASVSFYVSDRPGAIDQFEHLNVTITSVGFHQVDDGDDSDGNETENPDSDDGDDVENETSDTESLEDANETTTQTETNATSEAPETEDDDSGENDTEGDDSDERDDDSDSEEDDAADDEPGSESDGWVTHEVDNRTVDLTELQGANASRLVDFNISAGEYDRVFVHVGEVQGTLNNGEQVDVKLPSDKLQINKRFTAESGSSLDFVFDIMVHEAGNSGKYILRPVVSESGTGDQVEIDDVDADDEDERGPPEDAGPESDDSDDADDSGLELAVDGQVRAGETVTLTVTGDDAAVANATVTVDGETVGTTDGDGTVELTVPDDAEEFEVTVTTGDAEAEQSWPVRSNGGQGRVALPA